MARLYRRECFPHALLLFIFRMHLLWCGIRPSKAEESFVFLAAGLFAQFVETRAHRGTIEPSAGVGNFPAGLPPEFPEYLHCKIFCARRIFHDPANDPDDARVLSEKDGFEIKRRWLDWNLRDGLAICVHITSTTPGRKM